MSKSEHRIGVGCMDITDREKRYVNKALDSNRLSYGPFIESFEKQFSAMHGASYGVMVNSGTSALKIAFAALKERYAWKEGDEIIVPGVTFVATSNVLLDLGLRPIFVDVDAKTYNIDPSKIEAAVSERTRAIAPVHLFGLPCDMDPILEIAARHNLRIVEDSCETMFATYRGRSVGSFGDIACFSTYIAHLLNTGIGGLAVTRDPELAILIRSLANHGRDSIYLNIDDTEKAKNTDSFESVVKNRFHFIRLGYSYRVTEMEGALGLAQLERRDEIVRGHQRTAQKLLAALQPHSRFLQLPSVPEGREHVFMMFPILIIDKRIKKNDLVMHLERYGIETRDMLPLINQPFYVNLYGNLESTLPVSASINRNGFYIGSHQRMTDADIAHIAGTCDIFFRQYS